MRIKIYSNLLLTVFVILISASNSIAQEDFDIPGNYTIAEDESEEYNNLSLSSNSSHLTVNGTLVVNGNLDMSGNKSQFTMGSSAVVIVYGDFIGSNKVDISISSYLIVQGNFTRTTGSNQANIDIENGNVYIFGEVGGWNEDFTSCDDYEGDTTGVGPNCEYGTEDDFDENIDNFPPEISEKLKCFNLINPVDQTTCQGGDVIFTSETSSQRTVTYQWQVKTAGNDYSDIIGATTKNLALNNITSNMAGNLYRVKVRATQAGSGCKVSISKPATLFVETVFSWTGALGSEWNNAGNWLCNIIPNSTSNITIPSGLENYPVISSGNVATTKNLTIQSGASLTVSGNNLEIYGDISSNGEIDASTGTLVLKGAATQVLPSGLFGNNKILNLEIDNPDSVISNTEIELTGWIKLTSGNFSNKDNFTLISDANQTALVDDSGTGSINGTVKMQRYLEPAFGYKYFGSPFSDTRVGDFNSYVNLNSEFPTVFNYDENREDGDANDLSGWESYVDPASSFNILEGYALNFGPDNSSQIIEIAGTVNTGDLSRSLTTSNGTFTKGFHLVSNPYPSPINWNLVPALSTNIDAAAYFFRADDTDEYGGAYTSYVADISSSGGSGNIIPSMQGFFIHATEGTSSSQIRMNNSVRLNDFSQEFYKSGEAPNNKILARVSAGFSGKNFSDPMVVYFENTASVDFERNEDALKLYNSNTNFPNLYSITAAGKEISINGLPMPEAKSNFRLPLGIKTEKTGRLIIKLEDLENFSNDISIFLIDQHRRVSINLQEENYTLNLEKGEYKNRFYLSFSPAELIDPAILFDDAFSVKNRHDAIKISMNLKEKESGQLRISAINGQLLKLINVKAGEEISLNTIKNTGVYLVSFLSNDRQFSKKIIVRK